MATIVAALVLIAGWCPAVSDLGGDVIRLFLEQPMVKFERDDFGRWQIRDNAGALFYLAGDRVMMRYWAWPPDAATPEICIKEISGPRAERVRTMLEGRR